MAFSYFQKIMPIAFYIINIYICIYKYMYGYTLIPRWYTAACIWLIKKKIDIMNFVPSVSSEKKNYVEKSV